MLKNDKTISDWMEAKGWQPFQYQVETWNAIRENKSGLVNAPTGCGKTFSVFIGAVLKFMDAHPNEWQSKKNNGLQLLWITPLRALAKDIGRAMEEAIGEIGIPWKVGIRNGDTSNADRQKQKKRLPEVLIITPESLHLLLSGKSHENIFSHLQKEAYKQNWPSAESSIAIKIKHQWSGAFLQPLEIWRKQKMYCYHPSC